MSKRMGMYLLALAVAVAPTALLAQQSAGVLSGKATDEAKKPYTDYTVQLRDAATGQIVTTSPLNDQGLFAFANLALGKRYLVELTKQSKVVCTEGPFALASPNLVSKTDVNIDCGKPPAALWLLAAGAGTAAVIAVAARSGSR
jgi:hypothetical protein